MAKLRRKSQIIWIAAACGFLLLIAPYRNYSDENVLDAVRHGDVENTNFWLAMGGDPNLTVYVSDIGSLATIQPREQASVMPLLMNAVEIVPPSEQADIVAALLRHGAKVDAPAGPVWNPPFFQEGPIHEYADPKTTLQAALKSEDKNTATVRLLLDGGANPNLVDSLGDTPIFTAVAGLSNESLRLLLQHGARLVPDHHGATAFMRAAEVGNTSAMEILLQHGVQIDERDPGGKTALLFAAQTPSVQAIEFLLTHGANPNAQDKDGKTALHYALQTIINDRNFDNQYNRHIGLRLMQQIISPFKQHGAAFDMRDKKGQTPNDLLKIAHALLTPPHK